MGTQAMASQSGGTGDTAGGRHRDHIQTLARQGSLYNLTLNEVESHLGEPLLSMNLDELLRNVLPDDMNQSFPTGLGNVSSQSTSSSGLERQGSITMPPALSKKTVNEVWRGIQQGQESSDEEQSSGREAQLSLGEITLEDFLLRAGVVGGPYLKDGNACMSDAGAVGGSNLMAGLQDFSQGAHAMDAYMMNQPMSRPLSMGIPSAMDVVYQNGQMGISSAVALPDPQTPGRKRTTSEDVVDKAVDRRQKRMIKNRESAARSRARKQAYTTELENKLSRLEAENKKLKKEKELDKLLNCAPPPEPKRHLRRMSSAPF